LVATLNSAAASGGSIRPAIGDAAGVRFGAVEDGHGSSTTTKSRLAAFEVSCAALQEAGSACRKAGNLAHALIKHRELLALQGTLLASAHWSVIRTVDSLTDLLIEQGEDWTDACKFAEWSVQALTCTMPPEYPMRGVQLARAGKLQHHAGRLVAATQCYTAALEVLIRSHGASSPLVADLHQRVHEARSELQAGQSR
jgi:hypothetical protein